MKLFLFFKLFVISLALSLALFALTPDVGFMFLAKAVALGTGLSISVALIYPEIRGVRQGDAVSVVLSNPVPFLIGKVGRALSNARKNSEVRIRFDNGDEAIGVVESYSGLVSPPKVRIIYEEKIVE